MESNATSTHTAVNRVLLLYDPVLKVAIRRKSGIQLEKFLSLKSTYQLLLIVPKFYVCGFQKLEIFNP